MILLKNVILFSGFPARESARFDPIFSYRVEEPPLRIRVSAFRTDANRRVTDQIDQNAICIIKSLLILVKINFY